ncbi:3-hydroxyacyl-CoA dehydrogenase [Companilactobacillus metriopterae]|uniref:3-hydroxyacyl-CoA dehydrogenase n=1 Tax=Companilactobacillus metriopterae TaxID=1909267 RepID=UPI00100AEE44|nr:3-hydroxyacyl-CoA dehydrogenase [Companilactobacillus metriopterae]
MTIKNVTVAGSGVLGSQIAFQSAFKGFNVTIYDINDETLEKAKQTIQNLSDIYTEEISEQQKTMDKVLHGGVYNPNFLPDIKIATFNELNDDLKSIKHAKDSISFSSDLKSAVSDADLLIEAIPEKVEIKNDFYEKLGKVAPSKTIFATNSSTLLPSMFADITGRPEKFIALHFANQIWKNNTAEIMGHSKTDKGVYEEVVQFAKDIGMITIELKKEQPAYVLNSMLVPFLSAGQALYAKGVADFETIDKTWMLATKAPMGPFAILDIVGLKTAYDIVSNHAKDDPSFQPLADMIKNEYIDKGKMGIATGEGFYKYPNPAYTDPNFLS